MPSVPSIEPLGTGLRIEAANVRSYDLSWRRRLWLYRHGFHSSRDLIYDLRRDTIQYYLSDIHAFKIRRRQREWNETDLADDKLRFLQTLTRTHGEHLPELIAYWDDEDGFRDPVNGAISTWSDLRSVIGKQRVVWKPRWGSSGRRVHLMGHDGSTFTLDGRPVTESDLRSVVQAESKAIVTEYIDQAAYADRIYPVTTNTIRLLVMVDPETEVPFIASAVHRFGTDDSAPVDNWSAGGLSVDLDSNGGRLGRVATPMSCNSGSWKRDDHPDTGTAIAGAEVPAWDRVRSGVLDVADEYKQRLRYVGWDVVVTDADGSFTILEANANSDLDLLQVHAPLLADERVERFYRHYGVI